MVYADQVREELDYDELNCTRLMPSLIVKVYFFFHLFSFLLSSFAFSNMVTLKRNTCTRLPLLLVLLSIFLIYLGWSMLIALMALLGNVPCLGILLS